MATNPFNSDDQYNNPFRDALQAAVNIAPVGAGVAVGFQKIRSNDPITPGGLVGGTVLGKLGNTIGSNLRDADTIQKTRRLRAAQELAEKLTKTSGIEEFLGAVSEQAAVIQSLAGALDDPMTGLSDATIQAKKEELMNLARKVEDGNDVRKIIASMVSEVFDNNEPGLRVLESRMREYRGLSPHLATPSFITNSTDPFVPINQGSLSENAGSRYRRLRGMVGPEYNIELLQTNEHTGAIGQYARITDRRNGRFKGLMPLTMDARARNARGNTQYSMLRMGEAGTAYRADAHLIDAQVASNLIGNNKNASLSIDSLRKQRGIINIADFFLDNLEKAIGVAGGHYGNINTTHFGGTMREILAVENRYARTNNALGSHIRNLGSIESNVARVVNVERINSSQVKSILRAAANSSDFDLGVGADRLALQNVEGRKSFALGMAKGSSISRMRHGLEGISGISNIDRIMEPIVGRAEQVINRGTQASIFQSTAQAGYVNGLPSKLGAGAGNILWDDTFTGGINKAFLLDVGVGAAGRARGATTGRIFNALDGSGQAFHIGSDVVTRAGTIPLLNPERYNLQSTKLLNRIMNNKGSMISLSPDEMRQMDGFIGTGASGARYLPRDPRMTGLRIGFDSVTDAGGKSIIHLKYEMDREMSTWKMFSRLHKGTLLETSMDMMQKELAGYGMGAEELMSYNPKHTVVGSGEMIKKAPATFMRQMATGFGMVSDRNDWESLIKTNASNILSGNQNNPLAALARMGSGTNPIGLMAASVMQGMRDTGVSDEKAGRVLAAVFNRGLANEDTWLKDGFALGQDAFEGALRHTFGSRADNILNFAAKGLAIGADTGSIGEGVGDWRSARGSIEPRFAEMLHGRLKNMGMSGSGASDLIASLYRRKAGYGDALIAADEMVKVLESVKGSRNMISELSNTAAPKRMTTAQLQKAMVEGGHKGLSDFLQTIDSGITLDLSSGSNAHTSALMKGAAQSVFNGQSEIYLAGRSAINAMRGTDIKTISGETNVSIGSEYEKMVDRFGRGLLDSVGAGRQASAQYEGVFKQFSNDATNLTASTVHSLGKGKISGSAFMVAAKYDMNDGAFMSSSQRSKIANVMKKTKGTALFLDDYGFLGMLQDYASSSNEYNAAGKMKIGRKKEVAKKLQQFYTGMELSGDQIRGVHGISARHPILSRGNVSVSQMFRHVGVTSGGGEIDAVFNKIKQSTWGKAALDRFGNEGVSSFRDVARTSNKKARDAFFSDFAKNLGDFANTEGGGRVYMPTANFDVHYGNNKLSVDFATAAQAGGDWDGDQWSMFLLDKRAGQLIDSTLSNIDDDYLTADTLYKAKSAIYADEAKGALGRMAKTAGVGFMEASERAYQDALKEKASKEATGLLDVALNELRRHVINADGYNSKQVSGALALLKVLEEHTTIKGKKLPVYYPFAEQLSESVDALIRSGDSDPFRHTMHKIFGGSKLLDEGLTINEIAGTADAPWVAQSAKGSVLRLDEEIDIITKAAQAGRSAYKRHATGATAKQMVNALKVGGAEAMDVMRDFFYADSSLQAGMHNSGRNAAEQAFGAAGNATDRILRAATKLNKNVLPPVLMGLGAMAVGAMAMGDGGYAPEPLMMPGDMTSPAVSNAMATGQLLASGGGEGPQADQFAMQQDRYAMMDRPINTGTTYVEPVNSYQVGVETGSPFSIKGAASYMSQIPGISNTSVTINDTRRPLTNSYLDRLTGEY